MVDGASVDITAYTCTGDLHGLPFHMCTVIFYYILHVYMKIYMTLNRSSEHKELTSLLNDNYGKLTRLLDTNMVYVNKWGLLKVTPMLATNCKIAIISLIVSLKGDLICINPSKRLDEIACTSEEKIKRKGKCVDDENKIYSYMIETLRSEMRETRRNAAGQYFYVGQIESAPKPSKSNMYRKWSVVYDYREYNIGIFEINKHGHAKFRTFFDDPESPWILLLDENPNNDEDFKKLYFMAEPKIEPYTVIEERYHFFSEDADVDWYDDTIDYGALKVKFTTERVRELLTKYKMLPKELKNVEDTVLEASGNVPLSQNKKSARNYLKAGMVSAIKHKIFRNKTRFVKYVKATSKPQTLSKTTTYTKQRLRPEEYKDADQLKQLKAMAETEKSPTPQGMMAKLRKYINPSENAKARSLYKKLNQQRKEST